MSRAATTRAMAARSRWWRPSSPPAPAASRRQADGLARPRLAPDGRRARGGGRRGRGGAGRVRVVVTTATTVTSSTGGDGGGGSGLHDHRHDHRPAAGALVDQLPDGGPDPPLDRLRIAAGV